MRLKMLWRIGTVIAGALLVSNIIVAAQESGAPGWDSRELQRPRGPDARALRRRWRWIQGTPWHIHDEARPHPPVSHAWRDHGGRAVGRRQALRRNEPRGVGESRGRRDVLDAIAIEPAAISSRPTGRCTMATRKSAGDRFHDA